MSMGLDPIVVGIIGLALFLLFLGLGTPIWASLCVISVAGLWYLMGPGAALIKAGSAPFDMLTSYDLAALPMFLLMANLVFASGLGIKLFYTAERWLGRLPGGLAMATIGGCAGFASVSASAIATASTIGLVSVPEMKKNRYDTGLALSCVSAGGTIGLLIPPSGMLIMYGIATQSSIAKLFLAGYIPGILQAVFYIVTILIICRISPNKGPKGPSYPFIEMLKSLTGVIEIFILFALVLGGLLGGIFTPTEAGAIGAFGAFLIPFCRKLLNWQKIAIAIKETLKLTGMIYGILIGAKLLLSFFAATNIPTALSMWVGTLNVPPIVIMIAIIIVYLILGTFLEENAMLWTTVPIFAPIVVGHGYDIIWFGIICCRMMTIGMLTPPFGLIDMVTASMFKQPVAIVYKNIWPFVVSDTAHVALLLLVPAVVMFLPNLAR